ncbi:MAG: FAD-dependent oxidoreductase, partial [Actinomycetota bacterium]|nr:FAD-dependent oxidoreductase [Actinomycetota bacterium]
MGAATAWALARAGHDVVLLEQFEIGHDRGSSHGRSRIFRLSYRDPGYVRMAQRALTMWRELEREAGEEVLRTKGGLDLGPDSDRHAETLEECGVPFERLDSAEVKRRFPAIAVTPGTTAVYQPDAGIVLADRAVDAFVHRASALGAEVRERTRVTALEVSADGVDVRTEDEVFRSRVAAVTAGAWARGLLAGARIDLPVRPTRETVAYFRADGQVPSVVEWTRPAVYGLADPEYGIKSGEHHAGSDTDPDMEEGPDLASVERLSAWIRERFPAADPTPVETETC